MREYPQAGIQHPGVYAESCHAQRGAGDHGNGGMPEYAQGRRGDYLHGPGNDQG